MAYSNLPPGVVESMIPGFDDDTTRVEFYEPPCPDCGLDSTEHVEKYVQDDNGNDGFLIVCPTGKETK